MTFLIGCVGVGGFAGQFFAVILDQDIRTLEKNSVLNQFNIAKNFKLFINIEIIRLNYKVNLFELKFPELKIRCFFQDLHPSSIEIFHALPYLDLPNSIDFFYYGIA
tara:strand:- start:534 stop:854 length:321 start_codon:yes stop_codon:yes gene_type:complete